LRRYPLCSILRRLVRLTKHLVTYLGVGLLLLYLLLLSPPGQSVVRRQVMKIVRKSLPASASVGSVRTDVWSHVDLHDVAFRDSANAIFLGRVRVRYFLPALLARRIAIRKVALDEARLHIVRGRDGRVSLISLFGKPSESRPPDTTRQRSGWQIEVRGFEVRRASLAYVDQPLGMVVSFRALELKARLFGSDSADFRLDGQGGSFSSRWWQGDVDSLFAEGSVGRAGMSLRAVRVRAERGSVSARGFVPFASGGTYDLAAAVEANLGSVVAIPSPLRGRLGSASLAGELSWRGTLASPDLKANVQFHHLNLGREYPLSGKILADVAAGKRLRLSVTAELGGRDVEFRYDGMVDSLLRRPRFGRYQAQLTADALSLDSLLQFLPVSLCATGGRFDADVWAEGKGLSPPDRVVLKTRVSGWSCGDSLLPELRLEGRLEKGLWHSHLFWGANSVVLRGRIDERGRIQAATQVDLTELSLPGKIIGEKLTKGFVRYRGEVFGSLRHPGFRGELWVQDLSYPDLSVDSLWARVRGSTSALFVEQSVFRVHGDLVALGRWVSRPELRGRLWATGTASGPISRPGARASVGATNIRIGSFRADSLNGLVEFAGDSLNWADLRISFSDTLAAVSRGKLEFRAKASRLAAEVSLSGRSGRERTPMGQISGMALFRPDSLSASASWADLDLHILKQWVPELGDLWGRASGGAFLAGPRSSLTFHANVRAEKLRYREMGPARLDAEAALDSGSVSFGGELWIAEDTAAVRFSGVLPLRSDRGWKLAPEPENPAIVSVTTGGVHLGPLTDWLRGTLALNGRLAARAKLYNAGAGWEQDVEATLRDVEIGWLKPSLTVSGTDGWVALKGALGAPLIQFSLRTGKVALRGAQLDSTRWHGSGSREWLRIRLGELWLSGGKASVAGLVPLRRGPGADSLRVVFRDFPVGAANAFLRGLRVNRGMLSGEIGLFWAEGQPSLRGELELGASTVEVNGVKPAIQFSTSRFQFAGDTIRVQKLEGNWGRGRLTASGWLSISAQGLRAANLKASARELHFTVPDVLEVRVDRADLSLTAPTERLRLSGQVTLDETRFIRNLRLSDLAGGARRAEAREEKRNRFLERLELDVGVLAPKRLLVDMNLGKLRLDANVAVSGTAAVPRFAGEVQVTEGYVLYLDRKFEVTRGVIRQYDPYRLNPEIDFEAVAQVAPYSTSERSTTYQVTLRLTGNLDHPTLALESTPPLSQSDIVSLLTLGRVRTPEEYTSAGEPGLGAVLVERARELSSRQVAGLAERRIERLLNLESVSIEGNLFELNQYWAPRVTITKRLAERLNLSYQTVVGHTNEQRIKISYRLTPILYLDGETDELGQAGIDLRARVRFK
jgi:autotransporter translocation and assembly factor TamB